MPGLGTKIWDRHFNRLLSDNHLDYLVTQFRQRMESEQTGLVQRDSERKRIMNTSLLTEMPALFRDEGKRENKKDK